MMIFAFGFFSMFLVMIPVIVPLFMDLGIDIKDFLILQAYFGIVVAIVEVPSGYISDLWGRKKTLLLGAFLVTTAVGFLYFVEGFYNLLIYQTILATGFSMISGADIAFLYDNAAKDLTDFKKTQLISNYSASKLAGETTGAILGGLIAVMSLKYVIIGQFIADLFLILFACLLVEKPFERMAKTSHLNNLKSTLRVFVDKKGLLLLAANVTFWSLSTFSAIWLFQKQWKNDGIDLKFFGYIWASFTLTSALFSKLTPTIKRRIGNVGCLLIVSLFPLIGYIGMANTSSFTAAMFGYLFAISRSFNYVFLRNELNLKIESKYRATFNSIQSLAFRLGFFVIGPTLGFIVNEYGIQIGYKSLLVLFSVIFLLFMVPMLKLNRDQPEFFSSNY